MFQTETLINAEIDADGRIVAIIGFDADDIDAAFAELDARYRDGEAAQYSQTWSVIAGVYTSFNRHEFPATTQDWVGVDHRLLLTIEADDMAAFNRAVWDQMSNLSAYMEAVHRLTDRGAVVSHVAHGVSQDGFDVEWRITFIFTVDGDLISGYELFDEADLDAALARFDELNRPAPRLENAASQVGERYLAQFTAHDWDAMAEILADDVSADDRRRVVGAGVRHGRDAEIADMRAIADLGSRTLVGQPLLRPAGRVSSSAVSVSRAASTVQSPSSQTYSASSRSTPTTGSRRRSCSTPTISTPLSRNSTPGISPARPLRIRARGRLSRGTTLRSTVANSLRRPPTG